MSFVNDGGVLAECCLGRAVHDLTGAVVARPVTRTDVGRAVRAGDRAPLVRADRVDRGKRGRACSRDQEHASDGLDDCGTVRRWPAQIRSSSPARWSSQTARSGWAVSMSHRPRRRSDRWEIPRRCRRTRASRAWRRKRPGRRLHRTRVERQIGSVLTSRSS